MNQASNLTGKPIVTPSGQQLDTVDEVIFDPHTHRVLCFIVERGGWAGGARILPWSDDHSITAHALIASPQTHIVPAHETPRIQEILENIRVVVGKKIMSPDGRQLGVLHDVAFDQRTGAVHEYDIIDRAPARGSERRAVLPPDDVEFQRLHDTALLVSAPTADLIEQRIHAE